MSDYETNYGSRYWDDLRAPATAINPPGPTGVPDRDPTTGLLLFDNAATEVIFVAVQMPHGWVEGSAIVPHVHWYKTTSAVGTVAWQLRHRHAKAGAVFTAWSDAIVQTAPYVSDGDTAEQHAVTSFGDVQYVWGRISMMWLFEIARVGASDDYAADAALIEFDVHYQTSQPGSTLQWSKYSDGR